MLLLSCSCNKKTCADGNIEDRPGNRFLSYPCISPGCLKDHTAPLNPCPRESLTCTAMSPALVRVIAGALSWQRTLDQGCGFRSSPLRPQIIIRIVKEHIGRVRVQIQSSLKNPANAVCLKDGRGLYSDPDSDGYWMRLRLQAELYGLPCPDRSSPRTNHRGA